MKKFKGIRSPLFVVLLLDFLWLLAVPALWLAMESSHTPMARYGVELPELDYEPPFDWFDDVRYVLVVVGADGSIRFRGELLTGDALVEELFVRAEGCRDDDGDACLCVILVAHRDVSYSQVAAVLKIARSLPVKAVLGQLLFVPARAGWGWNYRRILFMMHDPCTATRLTVRAPPEKRWESVLAAIAAEIPADSVAINLLLSEEEATSGEIEVSVEPHRDD